MNKNTIWNNLKVEDVRNKFGSTLALQELTKIIKMKDNYVVVGIPNSGIPSAEAYAKTLDMVYDQLITKNKNVNRTFILNTDSDRRIHAKNKYIFDNKLKGKNLILFDDSIVRGITMKLLVKKLKLFGVLEIHVRIAAPQIKYQCGYGIDIPTREELLMNNYDSIEKATDYLGCDSLKFMELDEIKHIMENSKNLCTGCFNNDYNKLIW